MTQDLLPSQEAERLSKLRDYHIQKIMGLKMLMESVWTKATRLKIIPVARGSDLAQRTIRAYETEILKVVHSSSSSSFSHSDVASKNDFSKFTFASIDETLLEQTPKHKKARAGHTYTEKINKILPSYQEGGRKELRSLKKVKKKRAKNPVTWRNPKERKGYLVPAVEMEKWLR